MEQSAVLREWWNQKNSQQLKAIVDQVRTFSDYLGDEVVLAVPADAQEPMLIAEARKPGLQAFLEQQFATLRAAGQTSVPQLIENPQTTLGQSRISVMVHKNVIAVGSADRALARVAALADSGANGGFLATPFGQASRRGIDPGRVGFLRSTWNKLSRGTYLNTWLNCRTWRIRRKLPGWTTFAI